MCFAENPKQCLGLGTQPYLASSTLPCCIRLSPLRPYSPTQFLLYSLLIAPSFRLLSRCNYVLQATAGSELTVPAPAAGILARPPLHISHNLRYEIRPLKTCFLNLISSLSSIFLINTSSLQNCFFLSITGSLNSIYCRQNPISFYILSFSHFQYI